MKEKNYTIEFWRFLGCVGIILLHFEGALLGEDDTLLAFSCTPVSAAAVRQATR